MTISNWNHTYIQAWTSISYPLHNLVPLGYAIPASFHLPSGLAPCTAPVNIVQCLGIGPDDCQLHMLGHFQ